MTVGNPDKRRRGEAVRAVLLALVKPDHPLGLVSVQQTTGLCRRGVLRHLAGLKKRGRIRGYTTARGVVRIW